MDEGDICLERICRVCIQESSRMYALSDVGIHAPEPSLDRMLASCTQLQMSENDGLPYQICSNCTYQLSLAFTFNQMCRESDAKLRQYISKIRSNSKTSVSEKSSQYVSDTVKQESTQIHCNENSVFNFNVDNPDTRTVKVETSEGQNPSTDVDDKRILSIKNNDSDSSSPRMIKNNKCTQTKTSDFLQTIYNCSECGKKFSSILGITNHMKWRHNTQKLFPCEDCDIVYTCYTQFKKHSLDVHQMELTDELSKKTAFLCQICEKSFENNTQLKHHMLVHGKKKIYNCEICQYGFNKLDDYEKHKTLCTQKTMSTNMCDISKIDNLKMDTDTMQYVKKDISNIGEGLEANVKEEPLDELLDEADRATQMLSDQVQDFDASCNDQDEEFPDVDNYSNGIESDSSEYVESSKIKRNVSKSSKKSKKCKYRLGKQNKDDDTQAVKYSCTLCPRVVSTSGGLKIHMAKHYSDQGLSHTCKYCGEQFSKSVELKEHERTHKSIKRFFCNSCDKSFLRQENLAQHMWRHMEDKPFQCSKCNKGFLRIEHLNRHNLALHSGKMKNPKTAFCTICKRGFTTEKYLETHMRMHTGDKTFTCKICNKSFNTKWHLKEHSKWHSAEKPFLCSECGQRFIRNDYLITHMRRHNGEKPYKCRFCGKGFPRATDLTVHERYHTGEKTHLCTVCGKGFQRQYNLTVHLRVHTGEKPYVCSYCGKRFAQGNDLKSHVRRHTGERFNCEICGEGFIQGYHLTQHKRSIHGLACVSHIRRVEKHIQVNSQNSSKQCSPQSTQTTATNNTDLQGKNLNTKKESTTLNPKEPITITFSTKIESDPMETSSHPMNLQSQIAAAVQSDPAEVDLTQRPHNIPALMPIVPLALFPSMHSRI